MPSNISPERSESAKRMLWQGCEMKAMTDEKRLSKLDIDGVKARVCNLSPHGV